MSLINFNSGQKKTGGLINLDLTSLVQFISRMPTKLKALVITALVVGASYFLLFQDYMYNSQHKKIAELEAKIDDYNNIIIPYIRIIKIHANDIRLMNIYLDEVYYIIEKKTGFIIDYLESTDKNKENEQQIKIIKSKLKSLDEYVDKTKKYLELEMQIEVSETIEDLNKDLKELNKINKLNND